jgi:GNAT superfamily N-acetyltransferase
MPGGGLLLWQTTSRPGECHASESVAMAEQKKNRSCLIRPVTDRDWPGLEALWRSLYEHQHAHGMLLEVPFDAYRLWVKSFQPVLERFAFVLVAEESNSLVGFFAGRLRSLPPHFGGYQVGHFSELFVADSHRRRGIADELLSAGIKWFRERNIHRIDLSVLAKNSEAREFYLRRGWVEELIQMVWQEPAALPDLTN